MIFMTSYANIKEELISWLNSEHVFSKKTFFVK